MAFAESAGARIFWCEAGAGVPIVFVHEFAGDHRSWDDQLSHFGRGWRCVTLSARGYPGSDAPRDEAAYGQPQFNADVIAVMNAAGIDKAHIVGLSMGGYTALMLGLEHADRCLSVVSAGAGSGSAKASREAFVADSRANAAHFERQGKIDADTMGRSATRIQLHNKDPHGWARFVAHLAEHPAHGAANTLRQVQASRPSLYDFEAAFAASNVPTLLIVGDEDEPCLDVNLWLKRLMPVAQLAFLPATGHAVSLEEPPLFNALVERFIVSVERGTWRPRDPRAKVGGITSLFPRT
jgi:pimeloyl-ACP methyl ester carboxylesterase